MTATSEFLANPGKFAETNVIMPKRGAAERGTLKAKPVSPMLTLYQVKGENRVLYAHIDPAKDGFFEVNFSEAPLGNDWFATYWLPWFSDSTYRITLTPSKKAKLSADMFFTAALTGCMVHVEGDPREPTVYHSNACNLPVDVPENKKTMEQLYKMIIKVKHVDNNVHQGHAMFPKGKPHNRQSVTVFDYAQDVLSPEDIDLTAKKHEKNLIGVEKGSVRPHLGATVFGVKSKLDGSWSFYYQSWTLISYVKNDEQLKTYFVSKFHCFWP